MRVTLDTAEKPDVLVRLKHDEAALLNAFLGALSDSDTRKILKAKDVDQTSTLLSDLYNDIESIINP